MRNSLPGTAIWAEWPAINGRIMAKTDIPGARQFRIVILFAAAVAFAVLGIESIRHYLDYMHAVNNRSGQDIMRGVQQNATLTYWLFWSALAASGLLLAAPKSTVWIAYFLCLAILIEGVAQSFYLAGHGRLYQPLPAINYAMFDPKPISLASPHPGNFVDGLSHDAGHRRTTVNEGKIAAPKLIYVFGGSTTYDVGNTDGAGTGIRRRELRRPGLQLDGGAGAKPVRLPRRACFMRRLL